MGAVQTAVKSSVFVAALHCTIRIHDVIDRQCLRLGIRPNQIWSATRRYLPELGVKLIISVETGP
jgi:hypothetical protein